MSSCRATNANADPTHRNKPRLGSNAHRWHIRPMPEVQAALPRERVPVLLRSEAMTLPTALVAIGLSMLALKLFWMTGEK